MRKMHVRRGDQVQVIAGNYKGARGQVLRTLPGKNRVVVEGVNMRKRHQRPSQSNPEGGIVSFEAPIMFGFVAVATALAVSRLDDSQEEIGRAHV